MKNLIVIYTGKSTNQSIFAQVIDFEANELFKFFRHILNANVRC